MFFSANYASPLGALTLVSDSDSIIGAWFEGQKYFAATAKGDIEEKPGLSVLVQAGKWFDSYFAGEKPPISALPLAPQGGEFRKAVWNILCEIPYGQCITYGEIAGRMAADMGKKRMSSQAVGGAVGHNPISVIIPCHRVVGANGSLTGYAGGISRKVKLLELEGADMSSFFVPSKGTAL